MKKITVQSNFHNTEATFYVPESITYTGDAFHWLWDEGEKERDKSGRYGPARKRYLETRRKLCTDSACTCGVKSEKC